MGGQEGAELLKQLYLSPGDRVRATTDNGTIYEIDVGNVLDGLLSSRVHRYPLRSEDQQALPGMTIEDASVFVAKAPYTGRVALGNKIEIIGINAETQERVNLRTSPVVAISHIEEEAS